MPRQRLLLLRIVPQHAGLLRLLLRQADPPRKQPRNARSSARSTSRGFFISTPARWPLGILRRRKVLAVLMDHAAGQLEQVEARTRHPTAVHERADQGINLRWISHTVGVCLRRASKHCRNQPPVFVGSLWLPKVRMIAASEFSAPVNSFCE
jgi:hypothetical protein